MKKQNMIYHQGTKGTKYNENHFLIEALNQIFFVLLGALVPIFHKPNYGNRYYTDLFKSFIEGRHGVLVVKEVFVEGVQ